MSLREAKDFEEVYCSSQAKLGVVMTPSAATGSLVVVCVNSMAKIDKIGHFRVPKKSHFQSEAKCEAIDMKMIFNYDANKTHFHNKGFALRLVLTVRFFGTRKWPIGSIGARLKSASTI